MSFLVVSCTSDHGFLPDEESSELFSSKEWQAPLENVFDLSKINDHVAASKLYDAIDVLKWSLIGNEVLQYLTDAFGHGMGGVIIKIDPSAFANAPTGAQAKFVRPNIIVFRDPYTINSQTFIEEVLHIIQNHANQDRGGIDTSVSNFEYEVKVVSDILLMADQNALGKLGYPYFPVGDLSNSKQQVNLDYSKWIANIANRGFTTQDDRDTFYRFLDQWEHPDYSGSAFPSRNYTLYLLINFLRQK
ncbi:MAG: hypothetical protein ACK5IJ_02085 [Mangrovibacterium sp.]